jgi:hypothetical protein
MKLDSPEKSEETLKVLSMKAGIDVLVFNACFTQRN